jgi:hypothetical protein
VRSSPETKGLVIFNRAKECVRISKHAGYKPFCFSQLQKSAQRIETGRLRELFLVQKQRNEEVIENKRSVASQRYVNRINWLSEMG